MPASTNLSPISCMLCFCSDLSGDCTDCLPRDVHGGDLRTPEDEVVVPVGVWSHLGRHRVHSRSSDYVVFRQGIVREGLCE